MIIINTLELGIGMKEKGKDEREQIARAYFYCSSYKITQEVPFYCCCWWWYVLFTLYPTWCVPTFFSFIIFIVHESIHCPDDTVFILCEVRSTNNLLKKKK